MSKIYFGSYDGKPVGELKEINLDGVEPTGMDVGSTGTIEFTADANIDTDMLMRAVLGQGM